MQGFQNGADVPLHAACQSVPARVNILKVEERNRAMAAEQGRQLHGYSGFSGTGTAVDGDDHRA